jgi:hypothetical protein
MKVLAEPFWVQKRGCLPKEYEDAVCPTERIEYEQNEVCVAVADGATESLFARRWAEQLVYAVSDRQLSSQNLSAGLTQLQMNSRQWLSEETLPWYLEEKARQGAFAALVALELTGLDSGGEGQWHAAAVGDSCLFQIRGEEVITRFPIETPEEFNNRPYLLCSIYLSESESSYRYASGFWKAGDFFLLMTDALACYFLNHIALNGKPSDFNAHALKESDSFREMVELLRDQALIRNDDCTLLRIGIS